MKTKEAIAKEVAKASTPKDFHAKIDNAIVPWILEAMTVYAQQQAIAFVAFREKFQREEVRKVKEEAKRLGGMFTWVGRSDEEIYAQFIDSQNNIKTEQ